MIQDLKQLACRYPRFGYRRCDQMPLRQSPDGPPINVKRAAAGTPLYCAAGETAEEAAGASA